MTPTRAQTTRAVIASVLGNGLEWFDFVVYGFFASQIAAAVFPSGDPVISLLATWGAFGVGFLVRPLSGVLFGFYADRAGRVKALTLMIGLMATGTLLVGLTPPASAIGLGAPLLMIAARVLQGLSVGGEYGGATALLVEYAPANRRSLFGSFQMMSQAVSTTLASLAAFSLSALLTREQLGDWGWRIPFILGALIGPIGIWMRLRVPESPEFVAAREQHVAAPPVSREVAPVLTAIGITVPITLSVYVWTLYMPGAAARQLGLDPTVAPLSTLAAGLALFVLTPIFGALGDRWPRWRVYPAALVVFALATAALFVWVLAEPSWTRLIVAQLAVAPVIGCLWGLSPAMMAALFPVRARSTGMAIGYNAAVILFGGLAPFILSWLADQTRDPSTPAWYVLAASGVGLTLLLAGRAATRQRPS